VGMLGPSCVHNVIKYLEDLQVKVICRAPRSGPRILN
jgi:hypothetical protein